MLGTRPLSTHIYPPFPTIISICRPFNLNFLNISPHNEAYWRLTLKHASYTASVHPQLYTPFPHDHHLPSKPPSTPVHTQSRSPPSSIRARPSAAVHLPRGWVATAAKVRTASRSGPTGKKWALTSLGTWSEEEVQEERWQEDGPEGERPPLATETKPRSEAVSLEKVQKALERLDGTSVRL